MCLQTFQHLKRLLISVTAVSYCCYKRISDCNKRVKRGTYWNCSSCSLRSSGRLRPRPAAPPHADGALLHHAGGGGALGDQRSGLRHHAAPPRGGARRCTQHTQLHQERRENLTRWKQRTDLLFVVFLRLHSTLFPPLPGFQCDEELLEVLKTDFQLRLLWGSRGAAVNQSDRYNKFNLILTALSRKLEPPPKIQTVIWRPNAAEFFRRKMDLSDF